MAARLEYDEGRHGTGRVLLTSLEKKCLPAERVKDGLNRLEIYFAASVLCQTKHNLIEDEWSPVT